MWPALRGQRRRAYQISIPGLILSVVEYMSSSVGLPVYKDVASVKAYRDAGLSYQVSIGLCWFSCMVFFCYLLVSAESCEERAHMCASACTTAHAPYVQACVDSNEQCSRFFGRSEQPVRAPCDDLSLTSTVHARVLAFLNRTYASRSG